MSTPEILEEYFSEYTTIELLQYKEQYEDILPLKTENIVPKTAHKIPKKIPSLYWNSVLKIRRIQDTMTVPITISEISTFLLKTKGSKIAANNVDKERQLKAIETLETFIE